MKRAFGEAKALHHVDEAGVKATLKELLGQLYEAGCQNYGPFLGYPKY